MASQLQVELIFLLTLILFMKGISAVDALLIMVPGLYCFFEVKKLLKKLFIGILFFSYLLLFA